MIWGVPSKKKLLFYHFFLKVPGTFGATFHVATLAPKYSNKFGAVLATLGAFLATDQNGKKNVIFFHLRSPSSEGVGQKTWYLGLSTSKVLLIFVVFIGQIQKIRTEN